MIHFAKQRLAFSVAIASVWFSAGVTMANEILYVCQDTSANRVRTYLRIDPELRKFNFEAQGCTWHLQDGVAGVAVSGQFCIISMMTGPVQTRQSVRISGQSVKATAVAVSNGDKVVDYEFNTETGLLMHAGEVNDECHKPHA